MLAQFVILRYGITMNTQVKGTIFSKGYNFATLGM